MHRHYVYTRILLTFSNLPQLTSQILFFMIGQFSERRLIGLRRGAPWRFLRDPPPSYLLVAVSEFHLPMLAQDVERLGVVGER